MDFANIGALLAHYENYRIHPSLRSIGNNCTEEEYNEAEDNRLRAQQVGNRRQDDGSARQRVANDGGAVNEQHANQGAENPPPDHRQQQQPELQQREGPRQKTWCLIL